MPAAVAIPSAVSAGSSLLGGLLGSNAAKKAAALQAAAAQNAATDLKTQLNTYNPMIGEAGQVAQDRVTDATAGGQFDIGSAVTGGQGRLDAASQQMLSLLQPYIGAGGQSLSMLMDAMQPGGDLNRTFTAADMQAYDPGYAFRMQQAQKAMTGSAAARGGALGGGAAQQLAGVQQNLASSEFANANARFTQQQQDRFNRLNTIVNLGASTAGQAGQLGLTAAQQAAQLGLTGATSSAGLGLQGATTAGQFGTQAAQQQAANALNTYGKIGDLMTGGAAAQAGGVMGSANAWGGALGGIGNMANNFSQYALLKQLMQNPALPSPGAGGDGSAWNYQQG